MKHMYRLSILAAFLGVSAVAHAQGAMLLNLTLPAGSGPHPAVLLLHGCSGILSNQAMWQQFLRERGYASANVDSFAARGVREICTDFSRVGQHDRVRDAYDALVALAARPEIDPKRIAVMGFSNGGGTTLASLTDVVGALLVAGSPRFRAGIALYPECGFASTRFYAPVVVIVGELDDWTPAASCLSLADKIAAGRPSFTTKVIPRAHHSFDVVDQPWHYYSQARNANKRFGYGATVEGSKPATDRAKVEVEAFLARELLAPN